MKCSPLILAAEEDAGDVLVIELGGRAGLLVEAVDVLLILGHLRRQDLEGHEAIELRVAGPEHRRHAADADRLEQLEVGQALAIQVLAVVELVAGGDRFGQRMGILLGNDGGRAVAGPGVLGNDDVAVRSHQAEFRIGLGTTRGWRTRIVPT